MDRTNRAVTARKSRDSVRYTRGMYIDGHAARRLQEIPEKKYSATHAPQKRQNSKNRKPVSRKTENRAREVSRETARNRQKAMSMGRGYVVFLAAISVAVLLCCVNYLQLRSEVTGKIKSVAVLESELSELREENNAYESQVNSDIDLNRIKKIAIGRLGMNYPREDQKKTYSMSNNSYVRQYQDVSGSK